MDPKIVLYVLVFCAVLGVFASSLMSKSTTEEPDETHKAEEHLEGTGGGSNTPGVMDSVDAHSVYKYAPVAFFFVVFCVVAALMKSRII
jgi:uncharacterized membrane protein YoaK (UPF0700 family)